VFREHVRVLPTPEPPAPPDSADKQIILARMICLSAESRGCESDTGYPQRRHCTTSMHTRARRPLRAGESRHRARVVRTRADLLASGFTRSQIDGKGFFAPTHGVHVPTSVRDGLELRCDALQLVIPDPTFSHRTAVLLYRQPLLRAWRIVDVTVEPPQNPPRRQGVKGYERELPPGHVRLLRGRRVTSPARTWLDIAAQVPPTELIVVGDAMLNSGAVTIDELAAMTEYCFGRRGVEEARRALPRLEPRSKSPGESQVRIRIEDEGMPRPLSNVDVFDESVGFIGCPDLLFKEAKIAIQYESVRHHEEKQFEKDAVRDQLMIRMGYVVLRATKRDLKPWANSFYDALRQLLLERTPRSL
jgi:hypothetical protein